LNFLEILVMTAMLTPLTAGGPDGETFDLQAVWYPVFYLEDLDPKRIFSFTLLGIDLVIWWDAQGNQWQAMLDQCPHRLAPLSQGRINAKGLLECPYHGWSFTGQGHCVTIPQQPQGGQAQSSQRACVRSFPTCVRQGLLFVFPGDRRWAEQTPVPVVDVLEDTDPSWVCLNTFRDLPYDACTLMENVLDSSHVPYTHHNTVGKRSSAGVVDLKILHSDRQGFRGVWEEGPRQGTLGRQETQFVAPGLMWHDLTSAQWGRTLTVVYATPIRKGECRLFARFPFQFAALPPRLALKWTPRWYSHLGQNRVLEDDQIFLHRQERYLEQKGGSENYQQTCYLPTKADLFVTQYRAWLHSYGATPFPGQKLGPSLTPEQLLDRYHSHTQHCGSCGPALDKLQKIRKLGRVVALLGLGLTLWLRGNPQFQNHWELGLRVIILLGASLWISLGFLEKSFYQGQPIPPRNRTSED